MFTNWTLSNGGLTLYQAEAAKLLGIIEFTSHYAEVTDSTKKNVLRHDHGYWLIVINSGQ